MQKIHRANIPDFMKASVIYIHRIYHSISSTPTVSKALGTASELNQKHLNLVMDHIRHRPTTLTNS